MDTTVVNALIAVTGVIVGAILTALASAYSARQKIREVELTYQQKLHENYLANARRYTNTIYVPISIALTKLSEAHRAFQMSVDRKARQVDDEVRQAFRQSCLEYVQEVSELFQRGADAFLTTELDERLRSFNAFLRASVDAEGPVIKVVVGYGARLPGIARIYFPQGIRAEVRGTLARVMPLMNISFGFMGTGFAYRGRELLAAPITSRRFEERAVNDVLALKSLIKEVTLGTQVA